MGSIELVPGFPFEPLDDDVLSLFRRWEEKGLLGFMNLPGDRGLLALSLDTVADLERLASRMVVTGIGGSVLGTGALLDAFATDERVLLADSPDSGMLSGMTKKLSPEDTSLVVVTKSGGTTETLAVFMWLHRWMSAVSDRDDRIVAVTDPGKGDLRRLAEDRNWKSLPVPPSVGGRFSVMSPVGMLPAAFAGIDVRGFLDGANRLLMDFRTEGENSLAGRMAAAFLRNFREYPLHSFFVYDDRLFGTAFWFSQLWAESLGKKFSLDGATVNLGQTPLPCRGPADQHSLIQLFMEGPPDKTVTMVTVDPDDDTDGLPGGFEGYPSMEYLQGLSLDGLRLVEAEATAQALAERGVPVTRIKMEALTPGTLGELMMALEIATVLCGLALGVNPLDQPGVERGKILVYKALGRPGY